MRKYVTFLKFLYGSSFFESFLNKNSVKNGRHQIENQPEIRKSTNGLVYKPEKQTLIVSFYLCFSQNPFHFEMRIAVMTYMIPHGLGQYSVPVLHLESLLILLLSWHKLQMCLKLTHSAGFRHLCIELEFVYQILPL